MHYHHLLSTAQKKNVLISFDHPLCNLKHITFLIILPYDISRSFPICFTISMVNSRPSFFSSLLDTSPYLYFRFHSFHSFCFLLALLLTSFFHKHISLYLAGPFVHPQLISEVSGKAPVKTFYKLATKASFSLLALSLLMFDLKSLFTLSSCLHVLSISFSGYRLSPSVFNFLKIYIPMVYAGC